MDELGQIIKAIDEVIKYFEFSRKEIDRAYSDTIIRTDYKDDKEKKVFFKFYENKIREVRKRVELMSKFSKYVKPQADFWKKTDEYLEKVQKLSSNAKNNPPKTMRDTDKIIPVKDWNKNIFTYFEKLVAAAGALQKHLTFKMKKL